MPFNYNRTWNPISRSRETNWTWQPNYSQREAEQNSRISRNGSTSTYTNVLLNKDLEIVTDVSEVFTSNDVTDVTNQFV